MKKRCGTRRRRGFFCQYINGTKGVISLFLAILMVPFVSIAGALINAARINSAVAVFDEALCNASNSTLGTYDQFLKKRFGLLAMSQDTSAMGGSYSVQNLISDTFNRYMEENLGVLSNTYFNAVSSAAGVYPLSDTDVLLAEVLEYGKYTVPTKMAIDGLSLDDWMNKLTKNISWLGGAFKTAGSTLDMGNSLSDCQEKLNDLKESLSKCETQKSAAGSAYSSFEAAVNHYNDMVDEMKEEVAKCEKRVARAQAALHPDYPETYQELEAAQRELEETRREYHDRLIPLRNAVKAEKAAYAGELTELAEKVKAAGEDTLEAQTGVETVFEKSEALVKNVVTNVYDAKKDAVSTEIKDLEAQKEKAEENKDKAAAAEAEKGIAQSKDRKTGLDNQNKVISEIIDNGVGAMDNIEDFSGRDYKTDYQNLYTKIIDLRNRVRPPYAPDSGYSVTAADERMEAAGSYSQELSLPLASAEVESMMSALAEKVTNSSFFTVLKALVNFIQAMFEFSGLWKDDKLNGDISSIRSGLPSRRTPTRSEFEEGDKTRSEYYKSIMGAYASGSLNMSSVTDMESTLNAIQGDINNISAACGEIKWYNVLFKLGEILGAVISMAGHLLSLGEQFEKMIGTAVGERMLLAGYIGYNTSNRTTYKEPLLAGEKCSLPPVAASTLDSLAGTPTEPSGGTYSGIFRGAETEYIIWGSSSEETNQTLLFLIVYLIRLFSNIGVLLMDPEIEAVASAAGAASMGIGYVVVLFLYCMAEPFVDSVILVNGGDLPIVKLRAYLTPSGIPDLLDAFTTLTIPDGTKNDMYTKAKKVLGEEGSSLPESYQAAVKAAGSGIGSKLANGFTVNYTQTLILIMLFLPSPETMLRRLGDVVQMEAVYHAAHSGIATYGFDLDKSYTYLRASGSFTANEFIRLSDTGALNSTNRVIYRGY